MEYDMEKKIVNPQRTQTQASQRRLKRRQLRQVLTKTG